MIGIDTNYAYTQQKQHKSTLAQTPTILDQAVGLDSSKPSNSSAAQILVHADLLFYARIDVMKLPRGSERSGNSGKSTNKKNYNTDLVLAWYKSANYNLKFKLK